MMTSQKNKTQIDKQKKMQQARTGGRYEQIWQSTGKCVFCDLKDKYILHEENGIALTINLYPYIDGQLMAIPRTHISSPKQLSQNQWETMRKFTFIAKKIIRKVHGHKSMWSILREGGVNAQMSVTDHLHVHFIPIDSPDFCKWTYRKLKNSPLQNAELYKQQAQLILKKDTKFEVKYHQQSSLPIACDVVIMNDKKEILFQKRSLNARIVDNPISLPGGHFDQTDKSLEDALQREVKEEINYSLDISKLELLDSRIDTIYYKYISKYLKKAYNEPHKMIWNTYLYKGVCKFNNFKANDDCQEIIWVPLKKAQVHENLSNKLKKTLKKIEL